MKLFELLTNKNNTYITRNKNNNESRSQDHLMARKKSFSGGINSLLGGTASEQNETSDERKSAGPGRPRKQQPSQTTVASFVINHDTLETMRALAYWERKKIKDVLEEAMQELIARKGDALVSTACSEYRKQNEGSSA